jgi:hypothetical protein
VEAEVETEGGGPTMPTTDVECLDRLRRAGWSIGDIASRTADGRLVWTVWGHNGENWIRAEGETSAEAWLAAVEQARLMGMLRDETGEPT